MSTEDFWNPDKQLFATMLHIDKAPFAKCLEPLFQCPEQPIKAHSIQNARILDQLVRNGHVVALTRSVTMDAGPAIDFSLVGRNQATTFTGLCGHHDETIFAPIEKNELRLDDKEHHFLLAYRAAYRELHATMETRREGTACSFKPSQARFRSKGHAYASRHVCRRADDCFVDDVAL